MPTKVGQGYCIARATYGAEKGRKNDERHNADVDDYEVELELELDVDDVDDVEDVEDDVDMLLTLNDSMRAAYERAFKYANDDDTASLLGVATRTIAASAAPSKSADDVSKAAVAAAAAVAVAAGAANAQHILQK